MSLPVLPKKKFTVKNEYLPKGKLELYPFTVGQEAIMLQVADAKDKKEKLLALKQVIQECIVTPNVEVSVLPLFIIEELFLRLRQHAAGEVMDLKYRCAHKISDAILDADGKVLKPEGKCGGEMPLSLDIREIKITKGEGHSNTIIIDKDEQIGLKFKYPSIETYEKADDEIKEERDLIIECIDCIFHGDNVYSASEHTKEELLEFWNQFTLSQKNEVYQTFFNGIPHIHYEKELKCSKCGNTHKLEINKLDDLF